MKKATGPTKCTILIRLKGKYCLNDEKGGTGAKE
jgi:hypothetical protein